MGGPPEVDLARAALTRTVVIALILVAAVAAALLLPPVQTALVRAAVGGVDGMTIGVDRVWAGPWGGEVRGLRLATPGFEVTVDRAEANFACWSSLGHLAFDIERASASGIDIRIGPFVAKEGEEAAEPFEFRGIGRFARLPRRVVVRSAAADGTLMIAATDELAIAGPWSLNASGLGPGRRLEGGLRSTLELRRTGDALAGAAIETSLAADIDEVGAVRRATATGSILSLGDNPAGLDAGVELELGDAAESYRVTVDGSGGRRLIELRAGFTPEPRLLDASWEATATPGLVATFAHGRALPELWGSSSGTARLDLEAGRLEVDTFSRFEGRGLGEFDPRLAEVEELVLELDVAGVLDGGELDARRLRFALAPASGRAVGRVEALQPVRLRLRSWEAIPETWGEPALRIEAERLPLRWTRGFDSGVVVEDGAVSAQLDVVPLAPKHLVLMAREPIRAHGLQLEAQETGRRTQRLDITVVPRLEIDHGTLVAQVERLEMSGDTGLRVGFSGGITTSRERWPVLAADGDLVLRIPMLQRALESLDAVHGGARFELDLERMVLAVDAARLDATAADGRALVALELDNERPLEIGLPGMHPDWGSAGPQQLRLRFDGLPISWLSPYIPELDFQGGALHGELAAVAGGGAGVTLEPVAPFELRGLRPFYRGIQLAEGATAIFSPRLRLDSTHARFSLDEIQLRTAAGGRLDGQVVLEMPRDGRRRIAMELWIESDFPEISRHIGRLGALSWRQQGVIDVASRSVEVSSLELGLTDAAGTRFLQLDAIRPFTVTAEPFAVAAGEGPPEILLATVTPLELQQLFPQAFGFELEGVLPQGQFVGRAENGALVLAADQALVFKDVTVRWEDAVLLDQVAVGLTYEVVYSADGLQARSIDFTTVGPRGTPIADTSLRAVMPLTDRTTVESFHFETLANLEPLTRQPIFAGLPAFLEGTIGGSVDLAYGETSTLHGSLELRGARLEKLGTLPDLDAGLDVTRIEGQGLQVGAPLRMSSENGPSDLTFEGNVRRHAEGRRFDASLRGDRLVVPDVMKLVHLVSPPEPAADSQEVREEAVTAFREKWSKTAIAQLRERRDSAPFWGAGVSGEASLELGTLELVHGSVDGIRGRLTVDPAAMALTGVEASMLGAQLAAEGAVRFDEAAELPYELRFDSSFTDLDLGRLFRAVAPDTPPTLEGVFDVRTAASGRGRNLADLGLGTLGELQLSGRDGVFRGLAGQFGMARRGAKVLGVITFSKQLKAVSRLLGELESLEFSSFELTLERETPRRFAIAGLEVVSPLARIEGEGAVEVEPGLPLVSSPLDARFDLATQGDMTILFEGMGLLQEGTDETGYRPLIRPVEVGGTIAEPDTSQFYEMLDEASRDSKGVVGVAMRRVNKQLQKTQSAPVP